MRKTTTRTQAKLPTSPATAPNLLSFLRWRLTCRGDLATSRLRVLTSKPLPCESWFSKLWQCCHRHRTRILTNSCNYAIVRGRGEKSRGENRERGEWGNDRKRSNKWKQWKEGSKTQHKGEGSNALYSCLRTRRMKTKSKDLSFIHGPFEGRLNPKIALRPFCPLILLLLVAHGLDK